MIHQQLSHGFLSPIKVSEKQSTIPWIPDLLRAKQNKEVAGSKSLQMYLFFMPHGKKPWHTLLQETSTGSGITCCLD